MSNEDPTDRLAATLITPELSAEDVVMAAVAAQCCEQIALRRGEDDLVSVSFFEGLKDRLYAAAGIGMKDAGLTIEDIEAVMDELQAQAAIFQQPDR